MLLIPELLPDEFAGGYCGRIRILNGIHDYKRTMMALRSELGMAGTLGGDPTVSVLAAAARIRIDTFVREHSLTVFHRAVTHKNHNKPHGSPTERTLLRRSWWKGSGKLAFHCWQCEKEDFNFWGYSYWRRIHQIPGLDWCPKHGVPLHGTSILAFEKLPLVDRGRSTVVAAGDESHPIIRRYIDIALGLLDLPKPIPSPRLAPRLGHVSRSQGCRTSRSGRRRLLSDRIRDEVPHSWLVRHFPDIANKVSANFVGSFDSICGSRGDACATKSYVLGAAVLYNSADEALREMTRGEDQPRRRKEIRSKLIPENGRKDQIYRAYIDALGNSTKAANIMTTAQGHMADVLLEQGLPSLSRLSLETKSALFAFLTGTSINDACKAACADSTDCLDFLRKACQPLRRAMQAIKNNENAAKQDSHSGPKKS